MALVKINQAEYYYELHGRGQTIVLIAGYTCDSSFWTPILDELTKSFQVLIFDNRGIGRTIDNGERITAELIAKDIIELIRYLGIKNPHIVGHSMGGTIAQCLASTYFAEIDKLVLLHTAAKWRSAMLAGLKSLLLLRTQNVDFDSIYAATIPWIFGSKFLSDQNQINTFKQILSNNPYPQTIENQQRQFEALVNFDGRNLGGLIKAPTLVGYGEEDLISLPHEAANLAHGISNAKLVSIPGAHGVTIDAPNELIQLLTEFLC